MGLPHKNSLPSPVQGLSTGFDRSVPQHLIPDTAGWSMRNVICAAGEVSTCPGWQRVTSKRFDGSNPIRWLAQFFQRPFTGFDPFVGFTKDKAAWWNPTTLAWTDISPVGGLQGRGNWNAASAIFERMLVYTNGWWPWKWEPDPNGTGTEKMVPLGGVDEIDLLRAFVVSSFANHVLLGRVKMTADLEIDPSGQNWFPNRYVWSDLNRPEIYVPGFLSVELGTSEAGFADLPIDRHHETPHILAMEPLRDFLVIYTNMGMWLLTYEGLPFIFIRRKGQDEEGLFQHGSVVNFGDRHIFWGQNSFYAYNGVDRDDIGLRIRNWVYKNAVGGTQVIAYRSSIPDHAVFAFSTDSDHKDRCDTAVVFNLDDGSWTIWDFPFTAAFNGDRSGLLQSSPVDVSWDTAAGTWDDYEGDWDEAEDNAAQFQTAGVDVEVFGDDDGRFYQRGDWAHDTQRYEVSWESKIFDYGEPLRVKQLTGVEVQASRLPVTATSTNEAAPNTTYTLDVQVYTSMNRNGPYTLAQTLQFTFPAETGTWDGTSGTYDGSSARWDDYAWQTQYLDARSFGRFFIFRFYTYGKDNPWSLKGFVPFLTAMGLR